ncbi:TetR/AcrR family transcriptional regulator [Paraglaciecola aquimarina]|uniref:TetR/AcrR family transcriptional regulator n=1 Tax=Paraglaciecola aquimarina TaxID=1235557 RepID=A0ABU3STU3_9ALTE|nr:TetR/AcrR family transcriptional regulator [Paraglaciecola aquimarina]MDU0353429.1 TetR/AcrR family transcriptional regulator [Paraglaciecola aquimarina]
MLKSTQKIFETAKTCFFQHGYTAASIAMISRYSSISRVTIHKQFSSKEVLFRAFVQNFLTEKDSDIQEYIHSTGLFWQDTYTFLAQRCTEVFESIPNAMIKSDLIHAGQSLCADLIDENRIKTRQAIQSKLQQAIANRQISLDKVNLSIEEFAANIESVAEAIMLSSSVQAPKSFTLQTLQVYEVATSIN